MLVEDKRNILEYVYGEIRNVEKWKLIRESHKRENIKENEKEILKYSGEKTKRKKKTQIKKNISKITTETGQREPIPNRFNVT